MKETPGFTLRKEVKNLRITLGIFTMAFIVYFGITVTETNSMVKNWKAKYTERDIEIEALTARIEAVKKDVSMAQNAFDQAAADVVKIRDSIMPSAFVGRK